MKLFYKMSPLINMTRPGSIKWKSNVKKKRTFEGTDAFSLVFSHLFLQQCATLLAFSSISVLAQSSKVEKLHATSTY